MLGGLARMRLCALLAPAPRLGGAKGLWGCLRRRLGDSLPFRNADLRPYQKDCIERVVEAHRAGVRRQIVSLPVGSGKTVVFSELLRHIPPPTPAATKVLVLAHRAELLLQASSQIARNNPDMRVDMECGGSVASMDSDVIVASVPTLGRRASRRLSRFRPEEFKCIIIDEAHHSAAESYRRILRHMGVLADDSHMVLFGCSATVSRSDGEALGDLYEQVTFHLDIRTLMDEDWLCRVENYQVNTSVHLDGSLRERGDFGDRRLSLAINTPERNALVVGEWSKFRALHRCRSTLVFAACIDHVMALAAEFARIGVDAKVVSGRTPMSERLATASAFQRREFPVLINCGVFTEGTDLPVIDCLVMARPTLSSTLYIQMLGRGLRRHPEKTACVVIDYIDSAGRGLSLVSFPQLGGRRPRDAVHGEPRLRHPTVPPELPGDVGVLVRRRNVMVERIVSTQVDWIRVSDALHIVDAVAGYYVILNCNPGGIGQYRLLEWAHGAAEPAPLHDGLLGRDEVVRAADTHFRARALLRRLSKYAAAKSFPMSARQRAALGHIAARVPPGPDGAPLVVGRSWSKGAAMQIMSKYAFMATRLGRVPDAEELMRDINLGVGNPWVKMARFRRARSAADGAQ